MDFWGACVFLAMADPLHVAAGDAEADEIMAALTAGRDVIVETEFLGDTHEVTLRRDEDFFYCDTPTTLHKHTSVEEMRECLNQQGYAR
jgi:hypothetical protein